jgi:hypothetical protein
MKERERHTHRRSISNYVVTKPLSLRYGGIVAFWSASYFMYKRMVYKKSLAVVVILGDGSWVKKAYSKEKDKGNTNKREGVKERRAFQGRDLRINVEWSGIPAGP